MRHTSWAGGLFVALGICPVAAGQAVIHVPKDYPTIQEAIAVAAAGDEVVVEPGTYPETIDFLGKAITVGSVLGADQTTIDGAGLGDSVVRFAAGEGRSARLRGFTITGGEGGPTDRLSRGGGVLVDTASPTIIDCRIVANRANFGGGVFVDKGSPAFVNCVFQSNEAGFGGGIFNNNSFPTVSNCTFRANEAGFGGGIYSVGGAPVVANSILWGNDQDEIVGSNPTVSFSNVMGGWFGAGSGNIDDDPQFVDGDGRLGPNSPCIDAGSNEFVPSGVDTDIDGRARIIRARGETAIVDMGAHEFDTCAVADLDDSGAVDFGDLLVILESWGPCPLSGGEKCPADIVENGIVDFGDVVVILLTWGPCG